MHVNTCVKQSVKKLLVGTDGPSPGGSSLILDEEWSKDYKLVCEQAANASIITAASPAKI